MLDLEGKLNSLEFASSLCSSKTNFTVTATMIGPFHFFPPPENQDFFWGSIVKGGEGALGGWLLVMVNDFL